MSTSSISREDASSLSPLRDPVGDEATPDLQLDVIREMLSTMDTLPEAGQRYIMTKVVGFLGTRMPLGALARSRRNEAMLREILARLERESTCLVVNADRFNHHAETLLDLLEVLARGVRTFGAPFEPAARIVAAA